MAFPSDSELVPMYLAYGKACFAAQNFEIALHSLLSTIGMQSKLAGNLEKGKLLEDEKMIRALGDLFETAIKHDYFTTAEKKIVKEAIKERNHLIHSFWRKKILVAHTDKGRFWIIANITQIHDLIARATDIVQELNVRRQSEMGIAEHIAAAAEEWFESDIPIPDELLH